MLPMRYTETNNKVWALINTDGGYYKVLIIYMLYECFVLHKNNIAIITCLNVLIEFVNSITFVYMLELYLVIII